MKLVINDGKFILFRSNLYVNRDLDLNLERWIFQKLNRMQSYYFHVLRYETSNAEFRVIIISKLQVHELCIGRNLQEDDLSRR